MSIGQKYACYSRLRVLQIVKTACYIRKHTIYDCVDMRDANYLAQNSKFYHLCWYLIEALPKFFFVYLPPVQKVSNIGWLWVN